MNALGLPPTLYWLPALVRPEMALGWSLAEWEQAVRATRRLRLLARLAAGLDRAGLSDRVPSPVKRHLLAEQRLSRWRTTHMTWALQRISAALGDKPYPKVLLKGGAYIGQGLAIAAGRLPSDVDILVPRRDLDDAVASLHADGWTEQALDDHDRRYYREWSHEVPPMRHPVHGIELDLHHNILPPVADVRVDADLLLEHLLSAPLNGWQVLSPTDQLLHSAAHLFLDAEPRDRVRDLVDMDGLMRHFGADPAFWGALSERAERLGLAEPFALALEFTHGWLGTPIPDPVLRRARAIVPTGLRRWVLVALMARVLTPIDPDERASGSQDLAATLVLARYHWHRMPLRLLVPHLWHKWRAGRTAERESAAPNGAP